MLINNRVNSKDNSGCIIIMYTLFKIALIKKGNDFHFPFLKTMFYVLCFLITNITA